MERREDVKTGSRRIESLSPVGLGKGDPSDGGFSSFPLRKFASHRQSYQN